MTERCPFQINTSREAMPWEKLHSSAALFAWAHGDVDGIGGTRPLGQPSQDGRNSGDDEYFGTEAGQMVQEAQRMIEQAEQSMRLAVMTVRENGATWDQIGGWLGVSKQAAQQRYGRTKKG